jgi:hypothetical protein
MLHARGARPAAGEEDLRVREASAKCLLDLVPRLFYAEDWPGQDALTALVEREAAFLTGKASKISWCVVRHRRKATAVQPHPLIVGG